MLGGPRPIERGVTEPHGPVSTRIAAPFGGANRRDVIESALAAHVPANWFVPSRLLAAVPQSSLIAI